MTETLNETARSARRWRSQWNWAPVDPVRVSPYFSWPARPMQVARWFVSSWLPLSERLIILLLAIASAVWFSPSSAQAANLSWSSWDWIALLWIRNLALMCLVAGGLHLYFYTLRRQGDELRFDARPLVARSAVFTFGSQLRDNVFWTLGSGVAVWTAYEVLMLWALASGHAPALAMPGDFVWLALLIAALPLWETTYFFLIHRAIHEAPLYQRIHALHHRNTNVGPWSGLSMHPVEHVIYLGTVLVHFVVPSSPLLITFHLMYFTLSAATTHTGYAGIARRGRVLLPLGTFHHQLHHRYFTCNYGGLEVPWDQWTGSFHDGSPELHQQMIDQRKRKAGVAGGQPNPTGSVSE